MPRYIIERNFAEQLDLSKEGVEQINLINDQEGVKWIFSFLSADRKKTYCLYEATLFPYTTLFRSAISFSP